MIMNPESSKDLDKRRLHDMPDKIHAWPTFSTTVYRGSWRSRPDKKGNQNGTAYIRTDIHQAEITKRDAVIAEMLEVLQDNRKEFWEDWHSDMSECEFNSNPTIEDIDSAITKANEILENENEK